MSNLREIVCFFSLYDWKNWSRLKSKWELLDLGRILPYSGAQTSKCGASNSAKHLNGSLNLSGRIALPVLLRPSHASESGLVVCKEMHGSVRRCRCDLFSLAPQFQYWSCWRVTSVFLRALLSEFDTEAVLVVWKRSYTCSGAVLAMLGPPGHSLTLCLPNVSSAKLAWAWALSMLGICSGYSATPLWIFCIQICEVNNKSIYWAMLKMDLNTSSNCSRENFFPFFSL